MGGYFILSTKIPSPIMQSSDEWLISLIPSRLPLCNAVHIIYVHIVLFGFSIISILADSEIFTPLQSRFVPIQRQ